MHQNVMRNLDHSETFLFLKKPKKDIIMTIMRPLLQLFGSYTDPNNLRIGTHIN